MKNETVDILLATYNGFSFIASQMNSILSQSHKDIHLIIRDDGSTDSTRKILETYASRFPERITLLPAGERLGVKQNFSSLMAHSTAPYIMFADQDDLWDGNKVSQTLDKMKEQEVLEGAEMPLLVHTDLTVVDRDLNVLSPSYWKYAGIEPGRTKTLNKLLMQNVVTGCSMMMNRALLTLAYPIPEHAAMHDWWIALVAAAFGKIEILPQATLFYRQHEKNALGAQKYLSLNSLKQAMKKIRQPEEAKQTHANELLTRYFPRLNEQQRTLLLAYKKLPEACLLERFFLILRHRLYKAGFLRNLVNIALKKH